MIGNNTLLLPITSTSSNSTTFEGASRSKQNNNFATILSRSVETTNTSSRSSQASNRSAAAPGKQSTVVENAEPQAALPAASNSQSNEATTAQGKQSTVVENAEPQAALPIASNSQSKVAAAQGKKAKVVVYSAPQAAVSTAGNASSNSTATQGTSQADLATDESNVKQGQTQDAINSVVNPYALLMTMLQANNLSVAATAVDGQTQTNLPPVIAAGNNLQVMGKNSGELSAQTSLSQLLDQVKFPVAPTNQADVVKTALSTLTNKGNLTSVQLSQASTQIAQIFPGKPFAPSATPELAGQQVMSVSPLVVSTSTDNQALEIVVNQPLSDVAHLFQQVNSEQPNPSFLSKFTANQTQAAGQDMVLPSQPQVPSVTDHHLQAVPTSRSFTSSFAGSSIREVNARYPNQYS